VRREVASWTDVAESYTTSFLPLEQVRNDQCSSKTIKSGVSKVEVAFTSLMPGSVHQRTP
jgi:hypothetical protein